MKDHIILLGKLALAAILLAAAALIISGCQAGKAAMEGLGKAAQAAQATDTTPSWSDESDLMTRSGDLVRQVVPVESRNMVTLVHGTAVEDLRPVASGPGVVVCEPRYTGNDKDVANFVAGCGDWLDLIVAGQPEFGKSPMWESYAQARTELSTTDMELTSDQASKLYQMLGVNYVVVGTAQGTSDNSTLSYQIYALPSAKPVGAPIVATGSEAAVLAQLPDVARAMASTIGAHLPIIPAGVGTTDPDDFVFLGGMKHGADLSGLTQDHKNRLASLAQKVPTAGMIYTESAALDKEILMEPAVKTLFEQLPDNPLVYAHIGWLDALDLLPYSQTIEEKYHKYPNNYLLATTQTWLSRQNFDAQAERDAAEQAVRCSYRNPDAWLTLAYTISDEGDSVRRGRWSSMISTDEWNYLYQNYAQWLAATKHATQLDPQNGGAWKREAEAATCANDDTLAAQAIQKALLLDTNRGEVYGWGLEMYGPMWSSDTADLTKMANRAVADKYSSDNELLGVYDDLMSANCVAQASSLIENYKTKTRAKIAQNPNDGMAHWSLAACYFHQKLYNQAVKEYAAATNLLPDRASLLYDLGNAYDLAGQTDNAIVAFQKVLAVDPENHHAHYSLAYDLKHEHRFTEALPEFQKALDIDPYFGEAHYGIGELYDMENQFTPAIPEYRKAIQYDPYLFEAYNELARLLDNAGQYDESLQVAYNGLVIAPTYNQSITIVEDDFIKKHQYDKAIAICNLALKANIPPGELRASDVEAHENLGEAYIAKGDKAKAVAQWHQVLTYNNAYLSGVAKSFLAKYQ